ncbi:MAG: Kelch repeat-containing protein [Candidatus Thorarchaeota archaeon]
MNHVRIRIQYALRIIIVSLLVLSTARYTNLFLIVPDGAETSELTSTLDTGIILSDQSILPVKGDSGLVYDEESDRIIIFGGWNLSVSSKDQNETWAYNFNLDTYTKLNPQIRPPGRSESPLVYDSHRDRILVFGGMHDLSTLESQNDTWIFDYNTNNWTQLFPINTPDSRRAHGMAYDIESDKIIMFGGRDAYDNRTWVFDPEINEWQMMSPSISPSTRSNHKMTYDSESDRVILFGGFHVIANKSYFFSDTWAYDYNSDTWENLTNIVHPSERASFSFAYDSESDIVVLFGGGIKNDVYGDFWFFDYNTVSWTEMSPFGPCCSLIPSPPERSRHNAAYDTESDRIIIYGGAFGGLSSNDLITYGKTWAYDPNNNEWTQLTQQPAPTNTFQTTSPTIPSTSPTNSLVFPPTLILMGVMSGVFIISVIVIVKRR